MQIPLFEIKNVISQKSGKKILEIKNFEVHRGTVYTISGAPCSGKTALLKLMSREMKYNSGDIRFDGQNTKKLSKKELLDNIAIVPQETKPPRGTVKSYIEKTIGKYSHGKKYVEKRLKNITTKMEIEKLLDIKMKSLTPGQFRWVILAAQIAADTKILIIDEIEQHLSSDSMNILLRILYRKSNYDGVTIIVSTLNPEMLKKTTSVFVTMNNGRISSVRSSTKKRPQKSRGRKQSAKTEKKTK
ncbi:MAG: ABC transporter ATP-binding protein [Candidatus Marinimicrobia bacterium]|nr:ABC transporter ATP-binding protein [Candidatus Neomarinimicrobiota bacterium]MBL7023013.1 ABC transporter ATP-binding protein [Candidatus Neomarinimicrobiota bacterium]MBL7109653.1 ABC transporter ATP-binding protein [Candidatus Neomarinimicrobiota bacterium]